VYTRHTQVRTVQTANIATEIWRFPSAVEQDMAPVLMAIMKRLEVRVASIAEL
jgi:hypothetical protein